MTDPSRLEAAEAGLAREQAEQASTGTSDDHVVAADALAHPVDPNAGVVVADPPTGRALAGAAAIALLTLTAVVLVALAIARGR
ncbi:MAG: hypothetical protein M3Z02_09490 [Actinomycetota bacterium]|nr:hypothetical protein [Actinomycetota bacterium]